MSLDDQIRIALDGAAASLRQHLEADLRAFADEIVRASADDRERALAEAAETAGAEVRAQAQAQLGQYRAAAQKHAEHLKHVAESQIGEMRKALDELRTQAQQQLEAARQMAQGEIEKARGEVATAQEEVVTARGQVTAAREQAVTSRGELAKAQGELAKAQGELTKAQGEVAKAQSDVANAHGEAAKVRAEVEEARGQAEAARKEIEKARGETHAVRAESEQALRAAHAEAEKAHAEAEKARAEASNEIARAQAELEKMRETAAAEAKKVVMADVIGRAQTDSHQSELSRAARLADSVRNLDEARGLSEVLERLVHCAGHEVDRAAMLLVKGDRLVGWRLTGFGAGAPVAKAIDLSVEDAGLAGAVLQSGKAASRPADASDDLPSLPAFARDAGEADAMALPVRVGGDVVAVLYADAPRQETSSSDALWPAVLEVLVRHASRVLEAMTVQQAAGLSLPRPMVRGSHTAVPGSAQ